MFNDNLEIKGDMIDDVENSELLAEAPEGLLGFPEDFEPDAWANAPLSVLVARMVAGDDAELFDEI